jgi:hypothetical protein
LGCTSPSTPRQRGNRSLSRALSARTAPSLSEPPETISRDPSDEPVGCRPRTVWSWRTDLGSVAQRSPVPSDAHPTLSNICSSLQPNICAPGWRSPTTCSATHRLTRKAIPNLGKRTLIAVRCAGSASAAAAASRPPRPTVCARSAAARLPVDGTRCCAEQRRRSNGARAGDAVAPPA